MDRARRVTVLTVIPARGGSQRLPRKNLLTVGDRSLLSHAIHVARGARWSGEVVVSTEDETIAQQALEAGAEVPFRRPKKYAQHRSSALAVVRHALSHYSQRGSLPQILMYLQPTTPFRTSEDFDNVIEKLMAENWTSVISLSPVTHFHPQRLFELRANGRLSSWLNQFKKMKRSQDLTPLYYVNGAFYASRTEYLLKAKDPMPLFSQHCGGYVMDDFAGVDIDTEYDWQVANALWSTWVGKQKKTSLWDHQEAA